jgi:uncharacterized membrane protein
VKTALKALVTVALSIVVIITAFLCFCFSICAVGGDGSTAGNRGTYLLVDLVVIFVMVVAVMLIVRVNRKS